VAALAVALASTPAGAWPASLTECLLRDAQRLVPRSLARLLSEREKDLLEQAQRFPPELGTALAGDLSSGRLQPETVASLEGYTRETLELFHQHRVSDGIVHLGSVLRIPADLSDPVLSVDADGYPPGVVREYYAFIEKNLDKIPVVIDDPEALNLARKDLPAYWQRLLDRSRGHSAVIRTELFQRGRVVPHTAVDFRSPVFGVASLSYSRAVTAIAATWLALWREARGDVTRQPTPVTVAPAEAPSPVAQKGP
jgi:hypothetical protein